MQIRIGLTLLGMLLGTAAAFAGNPNDILAPEWNVDHSSARVLKADPMIIGGAVGDRILLDVWHNGVSGTLSLNCASGEFSVATAGMTPATESGTASNLPFAELLASTYCAKIDSLPSADTMTPLEVRLN